MRTDQFRAGIVKALGRIGTLIEIDDELWLLGGSINALLRAGIRHGVLREDE